MTELFLYVLHLLCAIKYNGVLVLIMLAVSEVSWDKNLGPQASM